MNFNKEAVERTHAILNHENETEIRPINPNTNKAKVLFAKNKEEFVRLCLENNGQFNIYTGINERHEGGTKGEDVKTIGLIVIDADPIREKLTSSTPEQLKDAEEVAKHIADYFISKGFNRPSLAMSGNGYQIWGKLRHIQIKSLDHMEEIKTKVKAFEAEIREKFQTGKVKIDSIHDPNRIIKVIGTLSIKGKIHRLSRWEYYDKREDGVLTNYILNIEPKTEDYSLKSSSKTKDKSRSGKEWGEICSLLRKGKTQEQIFKHMLRFDKWANSSVAYRNITYKNAVLHVFNKKEEKKRQKEEEEKIRHTSLLIDDKNETIAEQVYLGKKHLFAVYDFATQKINYVPQIEKDGLTYLPYSDDEGIRKGSVYLPTNPMEYSNDALLEADIKNHILTWLDIAKDILQFGVWNIFKSHVYERFHSLNYLRAMGEFGTGKSTFLRTIGLLHYKPVRIGGATTPAPMFRIIDKWRGTLLLDEGDFKDSEATGLIIKIINLGYEKGNFIPRCDPDDVKNVQFFDPYCPKVLATRKTFRDKATESRCITQIMSKKPHGNIPLDPTEEFYRDAQILRNKLLMWRFRNYFKITPKKVYYRQFSHLEPRLAQIVKGYKPLIGENEEKNKIFNDFIANYQATILDERKESFAGRVVEGILELLKQKTVFISASDIINQKDIRNKSGVLVSPRGLSSTLKLLGFGKSESKWIKEDEKTKRCLPFKRDHLEDMLKKFGYEDEVKKLDVDELLRSYANYGSKEGGDAKTQ